MENQDLNEFVNGEYTDFVYEQLCYSDILYLDKQAEYVINDVHFALELDERKPFLIGIVKRLKELDAEYSIDDVDGILNEIKLRFKTKIGKTPSKAIQGWFKGTTPGYTSRQNNYEICYALGMNVKETAEFFIKHYLTIPFNYKDSVDAVFYYCILHDKPYSTITEMLENLQSFPRNDTIDGTQTMEIGRQIAEIDDDDEFLDYLAKHCFNDEQQYQVARSKIMEMIEKIKELETSTNSGVLTSLFGDFNYQKNKRTAREASTKSRINRELPKRFTESLPNDSIISGIIKGKKETYETLRKTLVLLKFHTFYIDCCEVEEQEIRNNLYDFYDGLNLELIKCGMAPIYVCHPFDYIILYCANSLDPLEVFSTISEKRYVNETEA